MSALNWVGNEADPSRGQMGADLVFATRDGHITAGAVTDAEWAGLCRALGREDLLEDERFKTPALRSQHIAERRKLMSDEIRKWRAAEILERLEREEVPCAPILSRHDLLVNEQVLENEVIEIHEDAVLGKVRQPRPAARFDRTPAAVRAMAPFLGEHNGELVREIGYSDEQAERLEREGVLCTQSSSPPSTTDAKR
jgi:crotonobetainyl-CoA:carnitine CoA-transferase CaiB-like acyl-CoA transferase